MNSDRWWYVFVALVFAALIWIQQCAINGLDWAAYGSCMERGTEEWCKGLKPPMRREQWRLR